MESRFRKFVFTLAALGLLLALSGCASKSSVIDELKSSAKNIKLEKDQLKVTETILEFERSKALDSFWESSYGCVIFPVIGKGGIGIGGGSWERMGISKRRPGRRVNHDSIDDRFSVGWSGI